MRREAARLAEEVTPLPKKKTPKKKEAAPAEGPVPWDIAWPAHTQPPLEPEPPELPYQVGRETR